MGSSPRRATAADGVLGARASAYAPCVIDGESGQVLDGRFELVERLGSGGMGTVWRARDIALHREVAVKQVRPLAPELVPKGSDASRVLRERVLSEARALARLSHPHVVTIYHVIDDGDGSYPLLVMELVPGSSLAELLNEGTLLTPQEAARVGRQVLAALRTAHAAGIRHRDVKPANVMLRPDGDAVLTDFGIAALQRTGSTDSAVGSAPLTATGELIGTPDYLAPERIRGTNDDPASDLWSLGMTLYVCVEGHNPLRPADLTGHNGGRPRRRGAAARPGRGSGARADGTPRNRLGGEALCRAARRHAGRGGKRQGHDGQAPRGVSDHPDRPGPGSGTGPYATARRPVSP